MDQMDLSDFILADGLPQGTASGASTARSGLGEWTEFGQPQNGATWDSLLDPILLQMGVDPSEEDARQHFRESMEKWIKPPVHKVAKVLPQTRVNPLPLGPKPVPPPAIAPALALGFERLREIVSEGVHELEVNPSQLLCLNRTRRHQLLERLSFLANTPMEGLLKGQNREQGEVELLKLWIQDPLPTQAKALKSYYTETAIIYLAQALLLKAWSEKGLSTFGETELKNLHFHLHQCLRPKVPHNREGWHVTRSNLFSWYKPSGTLVKRTHDVLKEMELSEVDPSQVISLLKTLRDEQGQPPYPQGYQSQIFLSLWKSLPALGFRSNQSRGPFQSTSYFFSPTLRDGTLMRALPKEHQWVGLESDCFQLLLAELSKLWWGPQTPPAWISGSGINTLATEQLDMRWRPQRPSLEGWMAEMEACELSIVLEEHAVRTTGKSVRARHFKQAVDMLPSIKKLKSTGTTLGDLQACVALSKLRPGGLLLWMRDEPLSPQDGSELLRYLFDRAAFLAEWDFSQVSHNLPGGDSLFPRYFYVLRREPRVENRATHRPLRLSVQGSLRSHVEIPWFLEDAWLSAQSTVKPRGQWVISRLQSPSPQNEWLEHWPGALNAKVLENAHGLQDQSIPLGDFCTVRPLKLDHLPSLLRASPGGLVVMAHEQGQKIRAVPLSKFQSGKVQPSGPAFLVAPDPALQAPPIFEYLNSPALIPWIQIHFEHRKQRLHVTDTGLKYIPFPKELFEVIKQPHHPNPAWNKELRDDPKGFAAKVLGFEARSKLRAEAFSHLAHALWDLEASQARLTSVVGEGGVVKWESMLGILPPKERVPFVQHPEVHASGHLPPHLPIVQIEKMGGRHREILFAAEKGHTCRVSVDDAFLFEILSDVLGHIQQRVNCPTWSELVRWTTLPRHAEQLRGTVKEILMAHSAILRRRDSLSSLLRNCYEA